MINNNFKLIEMNSSEMKIVITAWLPTLTGKVMSTTF